jgi:hypothetical protein
MATYTNQTKNTTTLTNQDFSNLTAWASSSITWANAGIGWGDLKVVVYTKQTKNVSVLTNQTKN